jgi:signal transduction histidine kinase
MDDLIPRPDRGPDGQDLEIQALRDSLAMCTTRLRAATEALAQAGHIFETASQAKSEFLATISHEMRTPLNGVLGMLDLALATELSPEQREYLDIAKATAGFLAHVLVDILDFTKVEAGSLVLEQTEFSLRSSLEETVAGYRSQARAKGLGFSWAVPAEVPERLVGDPGRMRQVFRAVLDNAVKFTETGLVEASVSLAGPADGPAVGLMFSVRDTGPGIPEAIRSVVLDPFVQADGSMTRRYGGTGLGLALASRLAERMGGRIWIEEGPEPGSVVRFTLGFGRPARLEESGHPEVPGAARPHGRRGRHRPGGGARAPGGVGPGRAVRPGAHGCDDAGDGRPGRHPGHPQAGRPRGRADPGLRPDRHPRGGRRQAVPGSGDGRLPDEAGHAAGVAGGH